MSSITVDELITKLGFAIDPATAKLPEQMLARLAKSINQTLGTVDRKTRVVQKNMAGTFKWGTAFADQQARHASMVAAGNLRQQRLAAVATGRAWRRAGDMLASEANRPKPWWMKKVTAPSVGMLTGDALRAQRLRNVAWGRARQAFTPETPRSQRAKGAKGAAGGVGLLGMGLGSIGAVAGGYGIFQLGKFAIGAAADLERMTAQFEVMLGSSEKANSMVANIRNLAAKTPLTSAGISKDVTTLLQFGVAQDQVLGRVKQLGDIAGGSQERMSRLALAFAQTTSAGRLMGQDLLQFINAGFNPLKVIADNPEKFGLAPGTGIGKLKDMMAKGAVSIGMVNKAFDLATSKGGLFYNNMEKQSKTLFGLWSTFVDNFEIAMVDTMAPIIPILKSFIDWIGKLSWKPVEQTIQLALAAIRAFRTELVSAGILEAFALIKVAITDAFGGGGDLATADKVIKQVAQAVVAVITSIAWMVTTISATIQSLREILNFFGTDFTGIFDTLRAILLAIPGLWLLAFGPQVVTGAVASMTTIAASGSAMWATLTTGATGFMATMGGLIALLGVAYYAYTKIEEAANKRQDDEEKLAARKQAGRFEKDLNENQLKISKEKGLINAAAKDDPFFRGESGQKELLASKQRLTALQKERKTLQLNAKASQDYERDTAKRIDSNLFSKQAEAILNNQKVINLNQKNEITIPTTVDAKGETPLTPGAVQSLVNLSIRSALNVRVLGITEGIS